MGKKTERKEEERKKKVCVHACMCACMCDVCVCLCVLKDGATGARRRAGMRAHYSANTQQVKEREGEGSRGRQM